MPRHIACGLSLFLMSAFAGNAYAQKAALPLPEQAKNLSGFQTLLYIIPDDVELRVERHWLHDNDWFMRAMVEQNLLSGEGERLTFGVEHQLTDDSRVQLNMHYQDDNARSELAMNSRLSARMEMRAVLWRDEDLSHGMSRQGHEVSSRMRFNAYASGSVRFSDTGNCRSGCANLDVVIPL